MTQIEDLISFCEHIKGLSANDNIASAVKRWSRSESFPEQAMRLPSLYDDVLEVLFHIFPEKEDQDRYADLIVGQKVQLFVALKEEKVSGFTAKYNVREVHTQLSLIRDLLSRSGVLEVGPISREAFREESLRFLKAVEDSGLPEYAKSAMLMKIRAICTIANFPAHYSDRQIRMRVKAVYADFCEEFRDNDRKYEEFHEKLARWAKAMIGPGLFMLALGADVATVAQALPSPPKGLPAPTGGT